MSSGTADFGLTATLIVLGVAVLVLQSLYLLHQSCLNRRRLDATIEHERRAADEPPVSRAATAPPTPRHLQPGGTEPFSSAVMFDANDAFGLVTGGLPSTDIIRVFDPAGEET